MNKNNVSIIIKIIVAIFAISLDGMLISMIFDMVGIDATTIFGSISLSAMIAWVYIIIFFTDLD